MIERMTPCQNTVDGKVCGGRDLSIQEIAHNEKSVTRTVRCNACLHTETIGVNLKPLIEDKVVLEWNAAMDKLGAGG